MKRKLKEMVTRSLALVIALGLAGGAWAEQIYNGSQDFGISIAEVTEESSVSGGTKDSPIVFTASEGGGLTVTAGNMTLKGGYWDISSGTYWFCNDLWLWDNDGGTLTISGGTVKTKYWVGLTGNSTLKVTGGTLETARDNGVSDAPFNGALNVGVNADRTATIEITGGTVTSYGSANEGDLWYALMLGNAEKAGGEIKVSDNGTYTTGNDVSVGRAKDSTGTIELKAGGTFNAWKMDVGQGSGATGNVNISGGTMTLQGAMHVGNGSGATGKLVMTDGTLQIAGDLNFGINASTSSLTLSGGTVTAGGAGWCGADNSKSTMSISGGSLTYGGNFNVLNQADKSESYLTVNLTSGTLESAETWFLGSAGKGAININGGTYKTKKFGMNGTAEYEINLNSGTLVATAASEDFIPNSDKLTVAVDGNATIESANNITIAKALSGSGTLTKTGAGTLTLSAAPDSTIAFTLKAGALVLLNAYAGQVLPGETGCEVYSAVGEASTTYTLIRTSYADADVAAATEITSPKAVTVTLANDAQFIGTVNTKGLTKNGEGTLTLFGQNTLSGSVAVNAGTLKLLQNFRDLPSGIAFDFDALYKPDNFITTEEPFSWKDAKGSAITLASDGGVSPSLQTIDELNFVGSTQLRVWAKLTTKPEMLFMVWRLNGVGGGWPAPVRNNTNNANGNYRITVPNELTSSGSQNYRIEGYGSSARTTGSIWSNGENPAKAIVDTTQLLTVGDSRWYRGSGATTAQNTWFASDYNSSIGEILGYTEVMTASQRTTVETYLMNKWNINNTAWTVDYSAAEVSIANGAKLDLGDGEWTVKSLAVSGTGTATVQNGKLIVADVISLEEGQILKIPEGSTYTPAEGVTETTEGGVVTLTLSNTAPASINDVPYESVQAAIDALVAGEVSGTLKVYESAEVTVSGPIAETTVELAANVELTLNAVAPYSATLDNGKLVSVREAKTYKYVGPAAFSATSGKFTFADDTATTVVPDANDTIQFNSATSIYIGNSDITYAAFVLNADVTVTSAGTNHIYLDGCSGTGKLILCDKVILRAKKTSATCHYSSPVKIDDNATVTIYVQQVHPDKGYYYPQMEFSGALSGSVSSLLNVTKQSNGDYNYLTFSGDCSGFYGTLKQIQPKNANALRVAIEFSNTDFSNASVELDTAGYTTVQRRLIYLSSIMKFGSLDGKIYGSNSTTYTGNNKFVEIGHLDKNNTIGGTWVNNDGTRKPNLRKVGYGTLTSTVSDFYGYVLNDGVLRVASTDTLVPTTETADQVVNDAEEVTVNETAYKQYTLKYVAKIGNNLYETIDAALEAAGRNPATITLMQSYTGAAFGLYEGQTLNKGEFKCVNAPYAKPNTVELTLPEVANATATVTVGGEAAAADETTGKYTVPYDAEVTVTWTAAEGYILSGTTSTTFTASDETATVEAPDGMAVAQAVAKVGDSTYYATLGEAVVQAADGATVTLLADAGVNETIVISKNLTIALGENKTITANNCRALWIKSGNVTICGNGTITTGANNTFGTSSSVIRVGDSATNDAAASLTIGSGVAVTTDYCYGVTAFGKNNGISLVVNGTVDVTGSASAISGNGTSNATSITVNDGAVVSATADAGIYFPCPGTLTIEGGMITGPVGVYVKSGTVNVSGGTIKGTAAKAEYAYNANGLTATGDAIVVDSCNYPGAAPVVSVVGGEFTSVYAAAVASYQHGQSAAVEKFVSGGSFSSEVPLDYCATGVIPTDNGSGSYGVEAGYVITWDVDGVKTKTPVAKDAVPSYGESDPTKPNYTFTGWNPAVVAATADTTYTATWTANGVALGTPEVTWGADFTNAVVTSTVTGDYEGVAYTLTYGQTTVDGTVSGNTVTFNVPVAESARYADFDYTIAAKVDNADVGTASGSTFVADEKDWFSATVDKTTNGSWKTAPTVDNGKMTFTDGNTFTPEAASAGKIVVLDMGKVVFGDSNDAEIGDAQAAIRIGDSGKFEVFTTNNAWQETEVTANGEEAYDVVVTINYTTQKYSVKVGNETISNIALAGSETKVASIEFKGSGSLESLTGEYFDGAMVEDKNGTTYDTIAAAIAAYAADSSIAPLTMLHEGVAPQGWTIGENDVLIQSGITVDSDADKTLVAVPQGCTSIDTLIDLSNRYEGDQIQAYDSKTGKFNTWVLSSAKVWEGVGRQDTDDAQPVYPTEADKALKAGQAVWVLRTTEISKTAPIRLNASYADAPATVELETGWNLVAPTVDVADINSLSIEAAATDRIVVPSANGAAPAELKYKDGQWGYNKAVQDKDGHWVLEFVTEGITIPAGTGFWYISGSDKQISL